MLSVEDIPEVFQDLAPIPQNDGPDRVCVIEYPSAFTLAYNYMRAVWAAKELSGTCTHVVFVYTYIDSFVWLILERIESIADLSQQSLTIAWYVCKFILVCAV